MKTAIFKSWRTTLVGVIPFIIAALNAIRAMIDGDDATVANLDVVMGTGAVAIGFLFARDNAVSSETSGAK